MQIAFLIYNGMTTLDFVGVYDPVVRLKAMGFISDLRWEICAFTPKVVDGFGLELVPTQVQQSLKDYDAVIVPGGIASTFDLLKDEAFLNWLKTAETCKLKASVCTGALLWGKLGFLQGKKATTHPLYLSQLKPFCQEVLIQRIVDEGEMVTAGGVTSSIDLGLYLCEKIAGKEAQEKIRRQMDYKG